MGLSSSSASASAASFDDMSHRPGPKERAKAAIMGAFIADAASMPLNRIYDQGALEKLLRGQNRSATPVQSTPGGDAASPKVASSDASSASSSSLFAPEFYSPAACPLYSLPQGHNSHYGKEAYPLLVSIAACGFFDKERASELLFRCMAGPPGESDLDDEGGEVYGDDAEIEACQELGGTTPIRGQSPPPLTPVAAAASASASATTVVASPLSGCTPLRKSVFSSLAQSMRTPSPSSQAPAPASFIDASDIPLRLHLDYRKHPRLLSPLSRNFLEARKKGMGWSQCASPTDPQCLGLVWVPLIVARYAGAGAGGANGNGSGSVRTGSSNGSSSSSSSIGNSRLITAVEECVRMHQGHESVLEVARLAARLLEKVVLGMTVREALLWGLGISPAGGSSRAVLGGGGGGGQGMGLGALSPSTGKSALNKAEQGSGAGPGRGGSPGSLYYPTSGSGSGSGSGQSLPPGERAFLEKALAPWSSTWSGARAGGVGSSGHAGAGAGAGASAGLCSAPCQPFSFLAEEHGLDGSAPGCMLSSLAALATFRDYKTAVRANIVAGGESALRAWFIGAMLAAEGGEAAIPSSWKQRCTEFPDLGPLAARVAGSNPFFNSLQEINYCRINI